MRLKRTLPLLLAFVGVTFQSAHAQVPLKKTLPNGLTVVVQENHAAPVASVRIYVKTGSIYEGQYLGAGISHLFEHTLFEGTKTRDKKAINDEIQAIGGQSNAYTSYDVTCYHITTAAPFWERALGVLADMTQNATFPEAEVKTQQGVIHNEMNLGDDDPDRELSELFYKTAFRTHPVRFPIIGYGESFDRITRDDIVSYYKSHYTPENSVLSIAGDVKASEVFASVEKALGSWERRSANTPALPDEPQQTSPRRAVIEKDVNVGYLQMGWHTIPLQHPDLYALDTLSEILGGGASSRLVREIRENQSLVASIGSYSSTPNYNAGIFAVRATMPPANLRKAETAILAQVEKIKREGVTPVELARAQKSIRAAFVFSSQGVENAAEQAAYDELGTGDPTYSRRYVRKIEAVTTEQVQAAAQKYLLSDGLTTAIVQPRSQAAKLDVNPAQTNNVSPAKLVRLPNGARLLIRQNKTSPTVSIVVTGLGGVRLEDSSKAGVANLAAEMLTRGTKARNAEQIAQVVGDLGGSLDGFSGYNAWGIQSQWLSGDWRRGLSLVTESLLTPTLPPDELEKAKTQVLSALAEQDDDPMSSASLLLRKTFFGRHPYGRAALGTRESVEKITTDDIAAHWKSVLQPQNTVIAVYGDIDPEKVEKAAAYTLGRFQSEMPPPAAPATVSPPPSFSMGQKSKPGLTQAVLWFGYPSIDVRGEDRYALDVLDAALSGANLPGGRLHARLRDNQLVYVVHAYNQPGLEPGMFVVYAATTKANRDKVKGILEEEIAKVRDEDIAPDELERAKSMAIASNAIDLQTNTAQARTAAAEELYGLGFQNGESYTTKINAITLADVRRVAQKYLRTENAALAIVEPS